VAHRNPSLSVGSRELLTLNHKFSCFDTVRRVRLLNLHEEKFTGKSNKYFVKVVTSHYRIFHKEAFPKVARITV
jgi:hypothetical protein